MDNMPLLLKAGHFSCAISWEKGRGVGQEEEGAPRGRKCWGLFCSGELCTQIRIRDCAPKGRSGIWV